MLVITIAYSRALLLMVMEVSKMLYASQKVVNGFANIVGVKLLTWLNSIMLLSASQ